MIFSKGLHRAIDIFMSRRVKNYDAFISYVVMMGQKEITQKMLTENKVFKDFIKEFDLTLDDK